MDSDLVYHQNWVGTHAKTGKPTKKYKVKKAHLKPLAAHMQTIISAAAALPGCTVTVKWVRRTENTEAHEFAAAGQELEEDETRHWRGRQQTDRPALCIFTEQLRRDGAGTDWRDEAPPSDTDSHSEEESALGVLSSYASDSDSVAGNDDASDHSTCSEDDESTLGISVGESPTKFAARTVEGYLTTFCAASPAAAKRATAAAAANPTELQAMGQAIQDADVTLAHEQALSALLEATAEPAAKPKLRPRPQLEPPGKHARAPRATVTTAKIGGMMLAAAVARPKVTESPEHKKRAASGDKGTRAVARPAGMARRGLRPPGFGTQLFPPPQDKGGSQP
jgi:hypothetical protein